MEKQVRASAYIQVVVHYNIELGEDELVDILGCDEVEELTKLNYEDIKEKLEDYGMNHYDEYAYNAEVYSSDMEDLEIEEEELEEATN